MGGATHRGDPGDTLTMREGEQQRMRAHEHDQPTIQKSPLRWGLVALFAGVSAFFSFLFLQRLRLADDSDLHEHIRYAERMDGFLDIESPHFLFQWLLKAFAPHVIGFDAAAVVILGACYGLMAVLIALEVRRRAPSLSQRAAALSSMLVLVATHVFLLSAFVPNFYFGYIVPTAYHSASQQLNKILALALWFLYCMRFDRAEPRRASWRAPAALAVLCVLSAVAKPSFLIGFLPLVGLITIADVARRRWSDVRRYAAPILIPSTAALLVQLFSTYGDEAGIAFAPWAVFPDPQQFAWRLVMSLLFPAAAAILLWKTAAHSARLRLAWGYLTIALLYTILLDETGDRSLQGNFALTAQTGMFLM